MRKLNIMEDNITNIILNKMHYNWCDFSCRLITAQLRSVATLIKKKLKRVYICEACIAVCS